MCRVESQHTDKAGVFLKFIVSIEEELLGMKMKDNTLASKNPLGFRKVISIKCRRIQLRITSSEAQPHEVHFSA